MTEHEAIELAKSGWWKNKSSEAIVKFQLFEEKLCMDFADFHKAMEDCLKRPVFTHEFGLNPDGLREEFLGEKSKPTLGEIINLIPEFKMKQIIDDSLYQKYKNEKLRGNLHKWILINTFDNKWIPVVCLGEIGDVEVEYCKLGYHYEYFNNSDYDTSTIVKERVMEISALGEKSQEIKNEEKMEGDKMKSSQKAFEMLIDKGLHANDRHFIRNAFIEYGKSIAESSKVKKSGTGYIHQDIKGIVFENENQAIFAGQLKSFLPNNTDSDAFLQIFSIILKLGNVNSEWTFNKEKG